jgi:Bacterial cadherin-like domain/Bacterial Ig domain/Divergent InlB B-repeat domain
MTRRPPILLLLAALPLLLVTPAGSVIPTGFSQVVLCGSDSIHLKKGVHVTSGSVVVNNAGAVTELRIEKDVTTAVGYEVKADSIDIKKDAVIGGDVHYNELTNAGTILGALVTPLALPVFPFLPPFKTGPGVGPDVVVPNDGVLALPAGDYGAVTLGERATLTLSGGIYNVASIATLLESRMEFDATSEVRVAGTVNVAKDSYIGASSGGAAASEIVVYVNGVDGTLAACHFEKNAEVAASLYVPNGTLDINKDSAFSGAFLAKNIVVDMNTEFTLESFFFNRPPVAVNDGPFVTPEDVPIPVIAVLANDSDPDGDNLTITATPVAPFGTVAINDNGTPGDPNDDTLSYTPNADSNDDQGSHSFQYEVCDDGTDPGPLCDTATVFISVTPVNDPPSGDDQAVSTNQATPVSFTLTGDDGDPYETQVLTFAIDTPPAFGFITAFDPATGDVTYAAGDDAGIDSFTFTVTDDATAGGPALTSAPATVTITIIATNQPPVLQSDSIRVEPLGTTSDLYPSGTSLLANDSDPDGDNLSVTTTPVSGPSAGNLTLNADGTFEYENTDGGAMSDAFVYEACDDGSPSLCSTATVFITIVQPQMTVTITKSGTGTGSVTSSPAGIDCGTTCSATFDTALDLPVNLSAAGDEGSVFVAWAGDTDCLDGHLTAAADASCEAIFNIFEPPTGDPVEVTMTLGGEGTGSVVSSPSGIDCPGVACSWTFAFGTRVFFDATPDEGSVFAGYGGDADCLDAELDGVFDRNCTATFNLLPAIRHTLTVLFAGDGAGAVTSSDATLACLSDCSAEFGDGVEVVLNARPDFGSAFAGYSGECGTVEGFKATLVMGADQTCTATFNGQ